jgi:hypothetical protein
MSSGDKWWDADYSRDIRHLPLLETRLLLERWGNALLEKKEPDDSMKLAYRRLRDSHGWLKLPAAPPMIFLGWTIMDSNDAHHGYISSYCRQSLWTKSPIPHWDLLYLHDAPMDVRNDPVFMIQAIHLEPLSIRWGGEYIKSCNALVEEAIKGDGRVIRFLPASQNNQHLMELACSKFPLLIRFASEEIRNNDILMTDMIKRHGMVLEFASPEIRNNKAVVLLAVLLAPLSIQFASEELQHDFTVVTMALRGGIDVLDVIPNDVLFDNTFNTKIWDFVVKTTKGKILTSSKWQWYLDEYQIMDCLRYDPKLYKNLPDLYRGVIEFPLFVLERQWELLDMVPWTMQGDTRVVETVVSHDEWCYNVPGIVNIDWSRHNSNHGLIMQGLIKDRRVFQHANDTLRGNVSLVGQAIVPFEDLGHGIIDPLCTRNLMDYINTSVLATNLVDESEPIGCHFIGRFANAFIEEKVGLERIYTILRTNIKMCLSK